MATSTSTEPGFIVGSISRVISFGARAPGISTAPMTRSASCTDSWIWSSFDMASVMRPSSIISRSRMRSTDLSSTHTSACMPTAMSAAL